MITKHYSDQRDVNQKVKGSNASADKSFFSVLEISFKDYSYRLALKDSLMYLCCGKKIVLSRVACERFTVDENNVYIKDMMGTNSFL